MHVDYNSVDDKFKTAPPLISGLLSHAHIFSDRLMSVQTDYDASPVYNVKTPAVPFLQCKPCVSSHVCITLCDVR